MPLVTLKVPRQPGSLAGRCSTTMRPASKTDLKAGAGAAKLPPNARLRVTQAADRGGGRSAAQRISGSPPRSPLAPAHDMAVSYAPAAALAVGECIPTKKPGVCRYHGYTGPAGRATLKIAPVTWKHELETPKLYSDSETRTGHASWGRGNAGNPGFSRAA